MDQKKPNKIIFLDIDGVLCNLRNNLPEIEKHGVMTQLDPVGIGLLNRLCRKTNASIVISSSWAQFWGVTATELALQVAGLDQSYIHSYSKTPRDAKDRGQQIIDWLDLHKPDNITHYCIIDDDEFDIIGYDRCKDNLVKTNSKNGIMVEDYQKALKLLGSEDDL